MLRKLRMSDSLKVEALIFVVIFACSAYFSEIAYQTSNYTARLFLTQAIVDEQTFQLDSYRETLGMDGSIYNGHIYSSKPLGSSLMMLPQYILIGKPVHYYLERLGISPSVQNQQYDPTAVFVGWLVQILSLALYTAISFVALYRIFGLLAIQNRLPLTLISYFGTLMFAYATIGTGEMFTVPPILLGIYFLLLSNSASSSSDGKELIPSNKHRHRNYFWSGTFFALAFFTTNQVALIIIVAVMAIIWQERHWRPLLSFISPIAIAFVLTLLYNWYLFDNPFSFPIQFWEYGSPQQLNLELPGPRKLSEMLFLPWKGIFFYSPYLLLALPGFWKLYKNSRSPQNQRPISTSMVLFLAGAFIPYFIYLALAVGWTGGADFGFRYIVPVLPFLCIGAAFWLADRKIRPIEYVLIVISILICTFGALTNPEVPSDIRNPLLDYNLPLFFSEATNNVPNLLADQILGFRSWLFRLMTSVAFFALIIWLLNRSRHLWRFRQSVS